MSHFELSQDHDNKCITTRYVNFTRLKYSMFIHFIHISVFIKVVVVRWVYLKSWMRKAFHLEKRCCLNRKDFLLCPYNVIFTRLDETLTHAGFCRFWTCMKMESEQLQKAINWYYVQTGIQYFSRIWAAVSFLFFFFNASGLATKADQSFAIVRINEHY